jgi:hypothetical protein
VSDRAEVRAARAGYERVLAVRDGSP